MSARRFFSSRRPRRETQSPNRTTQHPDTRAMRLLEWPRIMARWEEFAASEPGRARIRQIQLTRDIEVVRRMLDETSEARRFLRSGHNLPFGGVSDIAPALQRARIGAALEAPDLNRIKRLAESSRRIAQVLAEAPDEEFIAQSFDDAVSSASTCRFILRDLADTIEAQPALEKRINDSIDEASDEVKDEASLDLLKARRNIKSTQSAIQGRLRAMLADQNIQPALQDAFVTVRAGRYCLPVKSDARSRVPGIIHDRSSGGGTVFVEPQSIVDLNNQLRDFELAEREAVEAVLRAITLDVSLVADALENALERCADLDFAFAKGRYSLALDASEPLVETDCKYLLTQARHPLIENCVPNDIRLGGEFDVLMITGPNTGGKTVVMKTLGLCCLMAMCGLHIPAQSGSSLFLPNAIWADIGDEQSIEQSLSTFSSHMTNIIAIMEGAKSNDLVLFDEIGAGTDPDEGAALAKAILRALQRRGVKILCTTHYGELKHFSASAESFQNASVEFDIGSLRPTYRLRIGVPGSSNALDITSRLGMSGEIVTRARKYLGSDRQNAEAAVVRLDETQRELEQQSLGVSREREEIERLRRDYEKKMARLESELERERQSARTQAQELVARVEREADAALRELRDAARGGRESKATETARGRLRDLRERTNIEQSPQNRTARREENRVTGEENVRQVLAGVAQTSPFQKGDIVRVKSLGREAVLLSDPQGEKRVAVRVGAIKIDVNVSDLAPVIAPPSSAGTMGIIRKDINSITDELNLIGKNTGDALPELEKYLDDALLSDAKQIRIVHGRGSGALRSFVHRWLRDQRSVREFGLAEQNEGGEGATIAKLG